MSRYDFDIEDGGFDRDADGVDGRDLDGVRRQVPNTLPAERLLAKDRAVVTVIARDEGRHPVFAATVSIAGLRLVDRDGRPS